MEPSKEVKTGKTKEYMEKEFNEGSRSRKTHME